MEAPAEKKACAWQPLTPKGVAAFAEAPLVRLLLLQLVVALVAAACLLWFLSARWFPVLSSAINHLPDHGRIRSGQLDWTGEPIQTLGENPFLAVTVDLNQSGGVRSPAHLQIQLSRFDVGVFSLFGYWSEEYPRGWTVPVNRTELQPWWGAWSPALLAVAGAAVVLGLLSAWALLASLYFFPVWLIGFFRDRRLSLAGSWRLAGAALMPGALFMSAALLTYGRGVLDLVQLMVALAGHFIVGWFYLVASPLCLPPCARPAAPRSNPFGAGAVENTSPDAGKPGPPG